MRDAIWARRAAVRGAMDMACAALAMACAMAACAAHADPPAAAPSETAERIVLEDGALRAALAPALGGRLMELAPAGGTNTLWTNLKHPASFWPNWGGEKTWVGCETLWNRMQGDPFPPPAFCESDSFEVVASSRDSATLLSTHAPPPWNLRLERSFRLDGDALLIRSRIVPDGEDAGKGIPREEMLNWSVMQVRRPSLLAARTCGPWRIADESREGGSFPEAVRTAREDWIVFDLRKAPLGRRGKIRLDADALAAQVDGRWLLVEQRVEPRFLDDGLAGADPIRAQLYFGPWEFAPEGIREYAELEFACLGADSEQELACRFLERAPWKDGAEGVR